jgi:hypothetical protein
MGKRLAAALVLCAAAATPAPVRVSGPSPYDGCLRSGASGIFANAEVEPSLAADPRDARRFVAVFQQDRYTDGEARGLVAASSRDDGSTWRESELPLSACANGDPTGWPRASDPWVSIGADGRAYVIGLGRGVAVSTSADGGATWGKPTVLAENDSSTTLDKCTVTADPMRPGVAYAVWQRYLLRGGAPPIESDTMLSVTTTGGRRWSPARVVLAHTRNAGDVASVVLTDPRRGGLVHLAYKQTGGYPGPGGAHLSQLLVQRSRNGRTWSAPRRIARIATVGGRLRDPVSVNVIRPGVPSFALDPGTGALYAAWQDSRYSRGRTDQVALARSSDGGRTWTTSRVGTGDATEIVPVVAATGGKVAVSYYRVASTTQLVLATSTDGGRTFRRRSVGPAFRLADAPLLAGNPSHLVPPGLFLGDYTGLVLRNGTAYAAFATANGDRANRTDIRFAKVRVGG